MRKINKKTVIASTASVGAVAALLFGGQAVSTAFTADSPTNYAEAQGATTSIVIDNGTFDAKGLVPGGPGQTFTVDVTNSGSAPATMTLEVGGFTVKTPGSDGNNPDASKLDIDLNGISTNAGALQNQNVPLDPPSTFAPGQTVQYNITESLDSSAGNNWNGADAYLPYTVHAESAS